MTKTNLLDIVDVLETYADLYDMFDDNRLVYEALDKVNEELRAIPYVNAIPVEWIVKRINHYSDLILTYPNEKELLYSQTELISLLEEWEKENEK